MRGALDSPHSQVHHVVMRLSSSSIDRSTAEADLQALASLQPDAFCELPAKRASAYVSAYLSSLPSPDPTEVPPKLDQPSRDPMVVAGQAPQSRTALLLEKIERTSVPSRNVDEAALRISRAGLMNSFLSPPLGKFYGAPLSPTRRGSFRPRLSMWVYAAIGIALILAANLIHEGGAEKFGEVLATAVVAGRAAMLKIEKQLRRSYIIRNDAEQPEERPPLADLGDNGWLSIILGFVGWLVALCAVAGALYGSLRLVGLEMDEWTALFVALVFVGLLSLEWGFADPDSV